MKRVLVLGAGASKSMGFPTSAELRRKILDLSIRNDLLISAGLMPIREHFGVFIDAFRRSQTYSIDAFLGRRPDFSRIGRMAIAAVLLESERASKLFSVEPEDHWYRYFFNAVSATTWRDLDFSSYSIITFNYDRSLEAYLLGAIVNSYGVNEQEASNKLAQMEIVHVYGSLGDVVPGDSDHLKFGSDINPESVAKVAERLIVIPEGRDDAETFVRAKEMLLNANQIAFLGFGFDALNLQRLDAANTCRKKVLTKDFFNFRKVVATCVGLKRIEAMKAFSALGQEHMSPPMGLPEGFYDLGCLDTLRESQFCFS